MTQKPWRSLGESNPSFQIEKRTRVVESAEFSCKSRPDGAAENCGCPTDLQTVSDLTWTEILSDQWARKFGRRSTPGKGGE